MNLKYLICKMRGRHSHATFTYECAKVYRATCPLCGYSQLITDDEIYDGIIEALQQQGRYSNIERMS